MKKFVAKLFKLVIGSSLLAGVVYLTTDAFGRTWREFVIGELAQRGLHVDFKRLLVNPIGGISAREVQVFTDGERKQVLIEMDHLNLDFNLGKLLEKKFVVEGVELSHTNVTLPVDSEDLVTGREAAVIQIEDLSARAFIQDGRIDLQEAEGKLSGIVLHISGELLLPTKIDTPPSTPAKGEPSAMQRVQSLHDHRVMIRKGLEWLKRFQYVGTPKLNLEVHGELTRPTEMSARLFFEAAGLSYGSYTCEALRAEAQYEAGFVDLTRFYLKDRLGEVSASATWNMGAEDVRFHLTSSADLPGVAQAFLDNDNLREIVFYESPHLALEGVWHVNGPLATHKRPVHVTGRLDCGRFSTRGEVFDGLAANIGVAPEGVYIRDLLLRHKTGTMAAQSLVHEGQGARYEVLLRMDPNAFLPFAKMKQTRDIIQRFEFSPESSIHLELTGSGPVFDPQKCLNQGRGDLRNFKYRGLHLEELQADVEFQHPMQHYRNVKVRRAEGVAEAAHVEVDDVAKWVKLEGTKSGIDPVGLVGVFAPKTADIVAKYRLPNTTQAEVSGTIFYKDPTRSDFMVKFQHPSGTGRYSLFDEDYIIRSPRGELSFKGMDMDFDVSGQLFGGPMSAKGRVDLRPESDNFNVLVTAARFPYEVFSKDMPFEKVRADVFERGKGVNFDVQAAVMGGNFTLKGATAGARDPQAYAGEMQMKNISLPKFAEIYWKGNDSQGDATGYFKFTGKLNNWQVLKGTGALTILNGNLYSIPIVGMLAPVLGTILPKQIAGYNIAKEADCTFSVADGFMVTKDFEALTSTFKILLDGSIDFINDQLDMNAQVRVRGLPGLVFLPFSELLEYKGTGDTANPKWEAKLLRGVSQPDRASRAETNPETMKEVGDKAADSIKPLLPQLKKALTPLFKSPGSR